MGDEATYCWHAGRDRTPGRVDPMAGPRLSDWTVLTVLATVSAVERVAGVLRRGARPVGVLRALPAERAGGAERAA